MTKISKISKTFNSSKPLKIFVFYNSPTGIKFKLNDGRIIAISGAPLSELYKPSGTRMTQGKFGITEILRTDWEIIQKLYAKMKIFESGRIFAANTAKYGAGKAKEQENQVNGNEQVNLETTHTQSA